jgi:hypothetical protein
MSSIQNDKSSERRCGCKIVGFSPNHADYLAIEYCPTHSLAFEMRELLEQAQQALCVHDDTGMDRKIKELLRKVKGTK